MIITQLIRNQDIFCIKKRLCDEQSLSDQISLIVRIHFHGGFFFVSQVVFIELEVFIF